PARARTDCESSSADRKSCEIKGLYRSPKTEVWTSAGGGHGLPAPFPRSGHDGLAQASQASAATSPMEFATRSVSSINGASMGLRHASLRPKSLEDHLIGIARGLALVIRAAHGPSEQREAQDAACDRGQQRRQVAQRVSDELRPRRQRLRERYHGAPGGGRKRGPALLFHDHAAPQPPPDGAQIRER